MEWIFLMSILNLRSYKEELDKNNRIITIKKEVNPVHEMAAFLKKVNGKTSLYFEKVLGYKMPVISGMCGNREDWCHFFGVNNTGLRERIKAAIDSPIPWEIVAKASCQEIEIDPPDKLLDFFPVPKFHEKDSGHFITAGVVFVKERNTGNLHSSIRRLQVNNDGSISILIESPGLWERYISAEKQGQDLEIAVALGLHPIILLASQLNSQLYTLDKMTVAGSLAGEAIPMVPCKSIDLLVPAEAEIVIEGKMLASIRKTEGPFGELAGYYGPASEQPLIKISKITHRKNPWFQVILPGSTEHKLPNALIREVILHETVKKVVTGTKDVHLTMPGSGRFHGIISIDKQFEGEGKTAIMAALSSNKDLKHVIVVNDDVDIFNPADVEWAIASRVQADLDLLVIEGARGCPLEPSHNIRGISAKLGIDATYPLAYKEKFSRINIPE